MKSLTSFAVACALGALGVIATGCAAETDLIQDEGDTADALASSKVKLPSGDPCRDVLAPLALGLADGARGLASTTSVTVSLTSETDTRLYTVSSTGTGSGPSIRYEVELDNDSHSKCRLMSARPESSAALARDARSKATARELRFAVPISVSPASDPCASTLKLLAQSAAISTVGASSVDKVQVSLVGETEDRDYEAHVDGKSFVANGTTFPNDADFTFNLSNDSAFKCFVQEVLPK